MFLFLSRLLYCTVFHFLPKRLKHKTLQTWRLKWLYFAFALPYYPPYTSIYSAVMLCIMRSHLTFRSMQDMFVSYVYALLLQIFSPPPPSSSHLINNLNSHFLLFHNYVFFLFAQNDFLNITHSQNDSTRLLTKDWQQRVPTTSTKVDLQHTLHSLFFHLHDSGLWLHIFGTVSQCLSGNKNWPFYMLLMFFCLNV